MFPVQKYIPISHVLHKRTSFPKLGDLDCNGCARACVRRSASLPGVRRHDRFGTDPSEASVHTLHVFGTGLSSCTHTVVQRRATPISSFLLNTHTSVFEPCWYAKSRKGIGPE